MDDATIDILLDQIREQRYPLSITCSQAEALLIGIKRVMDAVHPDDHVLVRGDYDAVTSALCHPAPE